MDQSPLEGVPHPGVDGVQPESQSHTFIVKIWLEETAEEAGRVIWRGYIVHVLENKRYYLNSLEEIPSYLRPYINQWV